MKRKKERPNKYEYVISLSKLLAPAASAVFYIATVLVLLLVITSAIVFFVNVTADKMLLPPFMKETTNSDGAALYAIDFGVGFKVSVLREGVSLADIKAVIYAFLLFVIASLVMLAPIAKFLSRFFRNISERNLFSEENARMINRTGVIVIIGSVLTALTSQFYIYTLATTFLPSQNNGINMSLGFNWNNLVVGGFIILLGSVYGCACEAYRTKLPAETDDRSLIST